SGRVLEHLYAQFDGGEHRDAARVAELERAARVDGVKQILNGDSVRTAFAEQCREPRVNDKKFLGKCSRRRRLDGAAGNQRVARSVGLDAAVTGALGPGIDAEDDHASEASISFSEMSKFDEMFCTSSWSSRASISFTIC